MLLTRLPLLLISVLLTAGCQQTAPVRDSAPAAPAAPVWQSEAPGWLPMHRKPRVGDFAVHQRLDAGGLTDTRRRTEVLKVNGRQVEIRQTYNLAGSPAVHYLVDHQGLVRAAWIIPADGTARQDSKVLPPVRRHRKPVKDKAPLPLVSGSFPVSEIVSRSITLDNGNSSRRVDYLSDDIPFRTLVSLSGKQLISHREAVRLIGRIAVLESPQRRQQRAIPITDGWVLMSWGRGKTKRR